MDSVLGFVSAEGKPGRNYYQGNIQQKLLNRMIMIRVKHPENFQGKLS